MPKRTKELQTQWWDWLSTAERVLTVLHRQTAALTLRRVEQVEEIQPELDELMERLHAIDDRAAALAQGLAEDMGVDPDLRSLVSVLEKAEAQEVQALANRVIVAGRNVQNVIEKNRMLIESELEMVNGTAAILMREFGDQQTGYGQPKATTRTIAMDAAA